IFLTPYAGEAQLPAITALIEHELSEPYNVYTYRYFLHAWPQFCFLAWAEQEANSAAAASTARTRATPIGVVVSKLEPHRGQQLRGYIAMLSVAPGWRGRRVATRLVHLTVRALHAAGAAEVVLETEVDNVASLALYESFGFIREKRLFRFYMNGKDCFRLLLPVPP
ncbi:acyl-CoA N-acyltransferase, partial [Tilletiopsis washingtonensis]